MGQARVTLEHLRASCRQRRAVAQGEGAWHIDAGPGKVAETQAGISALSRFTAAGEVCLTSSPAASKTFQYGHVPATMTCMSATVEAEVCWTACSEGLPI